MGSAKTSLIKRRPPTDVVGLSIGALPNGRVSAVRLQMKGGQPELVAAGVLELPGTLPSDWESARKSVVWSLPQAFQAPHAALVATSPGAVLRLTQRTAPAAGTQALATNGIRQMVGLVSPPDLCLETALPEYQVLWLSRLLPEGHQPTACSIQTAPCAMLNAPLAVPAFTQAGETALVLFVEAGQTRLVAYYRGRPVLVREQALGYETVDDTLAAGLGIERQLLQSMLEEHLVDPLPILEPLLQPLFRQIGLAADYVAQRFEANPSCGFVIGLPAHQAALWPICAERAGCTITFSIPDPLAAFTHAKGFKPEAPAATARELWPALCGALAVLMEARDE